jgi:hypothetical protein
MEIIEKMFEQVINKCLHSGSLICLAIDMNNLENVIMGKVLSLERDKLIIDEINPYGTVIRFRRTIRLNKIKLVSIDDIYGTDLKYLNSNNYLVGAKPKYIYINKSNLNSLKKIIESKSNQVVSTFINNDYFLGEITLIDGELIQVKNITFQGFEDGFSYFDKSLITKIRYDGPVEKKVILLRKMKEASNRII